MTFYSILFGIFSDLSSAFMGLASITGKGPSIKYVTLEGEGVREGVTVCDSGRGPRTNH